MEIKIVKLITGEEVLSKVEDNNDSVTLYKPMVLIMQQEGLQMVPWLMLAKEPKITIDKNKVVMIYEPRQELVTGYQQQIGNIVVAPANTIDPKGKLVV